MTTLVAWLMGSRVGQWALAIAAGLALLVVLYFWFWSKAFRAGQTALEIEGIKKGLEDVIKITKEQKDLRELSPDARREWVRRYAERHPR